MLLAPVAQWIEQPPSKRLVDGSIPSGRVYGFVSIDLFFDGLHGDGLLLFRRFAVVLHIANTRYPPLLAG